MAGDDRRAVVTLAIGRMGFWRWTHRIMQRYGRRLGADFIRIDRHLRRHDHTLGYRLEKLQIYELLGTYDRILFLDGDIVIRPDCPDLFAQTPRHTLGVSCEGRWYAREAVFRMAADFYGVAGNVDAAEWFNTGMMVVSREQRELFAWPERVKGFPTQRPDGTLTEYEWMDMPLLNCRRLKLGIPVTDLGLACNYLGSMSRQPFRPFEPEEAFLYHGSGDGKALISRLVKRWYGPAFFYAAYLTPGKAGRSWA